MRTFNFKARNVGHERYLTYTMGEGCELDEDVLDYCQENNPKELLEIIYEEDDDYDYLTYDITDRISLEEYAGAEMSCDKVLHILRNVANNLISLKEQAIHLSYILLNKSFVYIDEATYNVSYICLPVESKGSVAAEFKGFVRQLLANMKYDVDEDLNYVGKLLTYINSDSFNLRGLVGLSEALMDEAGISYDEAGTIDADGVEVVGSSEETEEAEIEKENIIDFMDSLDGHDETMPEIGDDEENGEDEEETDVEADEEELESILPAGMKVVAESGEMPEEQQKEPVVQEETSEEQPEEFVAQEEASEVQPEESLAEESSVEKSEDEVEEIKRERQTPSKQEVETIPEIVTEEPTPEPAASKKNPVQKETDEDLIKDRIKKLMGDTSSGKTPEGGKNIQSQDELDGYLDDKAPVVKKNVIKVNRAAIIQNVAAELGNDAESKKNGAGAGATQVPAIEDIYEDMNVEKNEKEKPKSKSILSKSVSDTQKANSLLNAPKAVPYLIRVNTEERIMLGKGAFKIGKATRGVDYTVSGNGAISRQHAVILQKDGVCYIKDNKSTNHTYINGKMIDEGAEEILTHDSVIKLGDEEFIFKIR